MQTYARMTSCIAITKKGIQCRNISCKWSVTSGDGANSRILGHITFCRLHKSKPPDKVIIEGINKVIDFVDSENYLATVEKFNKDNNERIAREKYELYAKIQADIAKKQSAWLDVRSCSVCGEEVADRYTDLINCSSASYQFPHLVCSDCLQGHVNALLKDGIANIECMFNKHDHCHGEYTERDIKRTLSIASAAGDDNGSEAKVDGAASVEDDANRYLKWQEVMTASEIIKLAGVCDNYVICPLCNKWGCIFEVPVGAEKWAFSIKCGACTREWCNQCKRASHTGRDCYQLAFTESDKTDAAGMERVIDKMIQDIGTRALTHCCGVCGCNYVKEEGCNLMTCPKCNGMSCFICGMKLYYKNETKYWHFSGHEKSDKDAHCPLWNNQAGDGKSNQGNTEFNIAGIGREFWRFIDANQDEPGVAKIICQRLIAMYGKDAAFNDILKNVQRIAMA